MARTVINDAELTGLVNRIIGKGHADFIREWMSWTPDFKSLENSMRWEIFRFKDLGYKDFKLSIPTFIDDPRTNTVIQADIQIWRPSKWFGEKDCRKIFNLLIETTRPRYEASIAKNPEFLKVNIGHFNFANETAIILEMDSSGCADPEYTDVRNDFVIFKFIRLYD